MQADYGDHSTKQANSRPPFRSHVMIGRDTPTWDLRSVQDHADDAGTQELYTNYSVKQANERPALRGHWITQLTLFIFSRII